MKAGSSTRIDTSDGSAAVVAGARREMVLQTDSQSTDQGGNFLNGSATVVTEVSGDNSIRGPLLHPSQQK